MTDSPLYLQIIGQNQTQTTFNEIKTNIQDLTKEITRNNQDILNDIKTSLQKIRSLKELSDLKKDLEFLNKKHVVSVNVQGNYNSELKNLQKLKETLNDLNKNVTVTVNNTSTQPSGSGGNTPPNYLTEIGVASLGGGIGGLIANLFIDPLKSILSTVPRLISRIFGKSPSSTGPTTDNLNIQPDCSNVINKIKACLSRQSFKIDCDYDCDGSSGSTTGSKKKKRGQSSSSDTSIDLPDKKTRTPESPDGGKSSKKSSGKTTSTTPKETSKTPKSPSKSSKGGRFSKLLSGSSFLADEAGTFGTGAGKGMNLGGILGKGGNLSKFAGGAARLLGGAARFAGPVGAVLSGGIAAYDGITSGMADYKRTGNLGHAVGKGLWSAGNSLTFGLLEKAMPWKSAMGIGTGIQKFGGQVWGGASKLGGSALQGIKGLIPKIDWKKSLTGGLKSAISLVTAPLRAMTKIISGIWNLIKGKALPAWNSIKNGVGGIVNTMKSTILNTFKSILKPATDSWTKISTSINGVVKGIKDTVVKIFRDIKEPATKAWKSISSSIDGVVKGVKDAVVKTFNGITAPATNAWTSIKDGISRPLETITKLIKSLKGLIGAGHPDLAAAGPSLGSVGEAIKFVPEDFRSSIIGVASAFVPTSSSSHSENPFHITDNDCCGAAGPDTLMGSINAAPKVWPGKIIGAANNMASRYFGVKNFNPNNKASLFKSVISRLMSNWHYEFYYGIKRGVKGTIANKGGNCMDMANVVCSIANSFGIPCHLGRSHVHGIPHRWADTTVGKFDPTAFVSGRGWAPLGAASPTGDPCLESSHGGVHFHEGSIKIEGPIYGEADFVNRMDNLIEHKITRTINRDYRTGDW
jgi:gas vesicle protein